MIDQFEPGNTVQFTWVSSVAPDAAPILKITGIAGSVVASITAVQSDSTHYFVPYTLPTSEGVYLGQWYATKTVNSSLMPFIKSFVFKNMNINQIL